MKFTRTRFQKGSLVVKHRRREDAEDVWELRFYEAGSRGKRQRRSVTVGTLQQYPSESAARKSSIVQATLLRINAEQPLAVAVAPNFGAVVARYEAEEMPERYSTRAAYRSFIKLYIRRRWADTPLDMVKPMAVEDWLKGLKLAPKTRNHIRGVMHTIFECARRWELTDKNPIELVRLRGGSKRLSRPRVLRPEEFLALMPRIREPHRTAVLIAGCLGLRVSEIMGLQWGDFDFNKRTVLVQRGVVHGRVGDVKTECSKDRLPLDPMLVAALLKHREQAYPTPEGWLFANPATSRPYHQEQIVKDHIRKAALSAGIGGGVGWHTFRHSYRAWLDEAGAPMGVQRELMRHASIQTTMNVYGEAMSDSKRAANSKVVEMVLNSSKPKETAARKSYHSPANGS